MSAARTGLSCCSCWTCSPRFNHHADGAAFAVDIRRYLEAHHGRPQLAQRARDELNGTPWLYK